MEIAASPRKLAARNAALSSGSHSFKFAIISNWVKYDSRSLYLALETAGELESFLHRDRETEASRDCWAKLGWTTEG
jgi:hypothetical protein